MTQDSSLSATLAGARIGMLAGGGLASWAVARRLHLAGADVRVYFANVGQCDEPNTDDFLADMADAGIPVVRADLRDAIAAIALEVARFRAAYDTGYWNTTGALRAVLVGRFAQQMRSDDRTVVAHGSVAGGNDHRRFTAYIDRFLPECTAYAPLSDAAMSWQNGRRGMLDWLRQTSAFQDRNDKAFSSSDGSLAGVSHEGARLESGALHWLEAPFAMARRPQEAPDDGTRVRVVVSRGEIVQVGDIHGAPQAMLNAANEIAGTHGLGLSCLNERRINGTLCRGVYEAPGLELLGASYGVLYRVGCSDPQTEEFIHELSGRIARGLYRGEYYGPECEAAKAALRTLSGELSGHVDWDLYKGSLFLRDWSIDAETAFETRFAHGGGAWQR